MFRIKHPYFLAFAFLIGAAALASYVWWNALARNPTHMLGAAIALLVANAIGTMLFYWREEESAWHNALPYYSALGSLGICMILAVEAIIWRSILVDLYIARLIMGCAIALAAVSAVPIARNCLGRPVLRLS